ncbi:hypothetical protein K2173_022458 [Erythroxylum novogranatense]|uniref:Small-subunit processome Utp12 domain-containing protein n=1 Tax=Erythroxylum novogranatense TaxID=1862640 RepID=A0AAV8TJV8_9ROSI|nr:hypothetical protein K2173_022458 [Erythroxylum novogranatense]
MVTTNIRDILTTFSPSLDYFAINSGDGRIKVWDSISGQLQTEFTDIASSDADLYTTERGHLSVDYTCMKWLSLDRKKKRKLGSSLLVLGTGSGDVLALDVSSGQLKWSLNDCHPGGVNAISFSTQDSCIYTAGADGMICIIDPLTGNMSGKFRASTKAISSNSVSSDGKMLATAAAQLKVFSCSDHKKIQKFSGHPGTIRFMIFTEDGNYILSSAGGERYVAIWRIDGSKRQSASCVLAMEHPAVYLDCKCFRSDGVDDVGLYVLAISEAGVCYTWCGQNVEELRNAKPTKVLVSSDESVSKPYKGPVPAIFAAKIQGISGSSVAQVFIAYGLQVKPMFQKVLVHSGTDIRLNSSHDGILLPVPQSVTKPKKGMGAQNAVTALDRANVEDALLPIPRVSDIYQKKLKHKKKSNAAAMVGLMENDDQAELVEKKDAMIDVPSICLEKQLRQLNLLTHEDDKTIDSAMHMGIDLQADIPQKKMRAAVLSMGPSNAIKLLETLMIVWQSRTHKGKLVLPWIYCILVNYGHHMAAQDEAQILDSLLKITKSREVATQPLFQLSGRLQLVKAQIDKAAMRKTYMSSPSHQMDDDEDDGEDIDECRYGEEDDESELSSDTDS